MKEKAKKQLKRHDSFQNHTTGLNTHADRAANLEIKPFEPYGESELSTLVRQNAYAGILVDELVETATQKGWQVNTEEDKDICRDFEEDWQLKEDIEWTWKSAREQGGALLMMIIEDGLAPIEPLDLEKPFELKNTVVVSKEEASAYKWDTDITSRNFGKPLIWQIQPIVNGSSAPTKYIHYSRVVYFGGQKVSRRHKIQNKGFDDPVLTRAMSAIKNKTRVDLANSTLIEDFKTDIMTVKNLDAIGTGDEQLAYFDERMKVIARSKSNINMVLMDEGETFTKSSTTLTGLSDLGDKVGEEMTAAYRMPKTKLNGDAPGGLNADGFSQQQNWNDQAENAQENYLKPKLVQLYRVLLSATNGPTDGNCPESFQVVFNPLVKPSFKQIADLKSTVSLVDRAYFDMGVITAEEIREERFEKGNWQEDLVLKETTDK